MKRPLSRIVQCLETIADHIFLSVNFQLLVTTLKGSLVSDSKFWDPMKTAVGKRQAAAVSRFSLNVHIQI